VDAVSYLGSNGAGEYAQCVECGARFFRDVRWKKRCLPCWKKANGVEDRTFGRMKTAALPPPAIPEDMLKRLIYLCHPDKHDGSKVATEVTAWLLKQRKEN
jgi:hypothetical protein